MSLSLKVTLMRIMKTIGRFLNSTTYIRISANVSSQRLNSNRSKMYIYYFSYFSPILSCFLMSSLTTVRSRKNIIFGPLITITSKKLSKRVRLF
jgi:hypothetical protein